MASPTQPLSLFGLLAFSSFLCFVLFFICAFYIVTLSLKCEHFLFGRMVSVTVGAVATSCPLKEINLDLFSYRQTHLLPFFPDIDTVKDELPCS